MKIRLLQFLLSFSLLVFGVINNGTVFAQSVNLSSVTNKAGNNGLVASPAYPQYGACFYGFSTAVTGSGTNIKQIVIPSQLSNCNTLFTNGKLYHSTSSTYNGSATQIAGAGIGGTSVSIGTSDITITGINDAVAVNTTEYYYLVLDYTYTGTGTNATNLFNNTTVTYSLNAGGTTTVNAYAGSPYYQLNPNTANVANNTTGVQANGPLTYGQTFTVASFAMSISGLPTGMTGLKITDGTGNGNTIFTNGKLFRNATASLSGATQVAGAGVAGTTVGFSGGVVTISGMSETLTSTTAYYFLVVDDIYYGTGGNFQPILNQVVTAGGTLSYNTYAGTYYSFNIPSPPEVNSITGGITANGTTLTYGQSAVPLFGFSLKAYVQLTFSQFSINSNLALGSYFSGFKLYSNPTNTWGNGTPTQVGTATVSGNYVNITSLSEIVNAGQTNYYFLVGDYSNNSGTIPASLQFNFTNGQSTPALTQSGPTALTYNNFSTSGNTYPINTANISMSSVTGLSSTNVGPGQTTVGVFGFGLSSNSGTSTLSAININSDNNSLGTYYGVPRLYKSSSSTYNAASPGTLVGSATVNGSYVNVTGLSETINNTPNYYYLVMDVVYASSGTNSTTFKFISGQTTNALVQITPASSYNNFTLTGSTYNIVQPTITPTNNTDGTYPISGLATGPLYYGQTTQAIYGFRVGVSGSTTLNGFVLTDRSGLSQSSLWGNCKLYRTTSSTFNAANISTYTNLGSPTFSGATIVFSNLGDGISNTGYYYYIVADDIYYSGSNYSQLVLTALTTLSGTTNPGLYCNYYNFSLPVITITGANSTTSNGITAGPLSYGQKDIVLFGMAVQVQGSVPIVKFNIKTSGNEANYFSNARIYRSTTNIFPTGTPAYTSAAVSVGGTSGYFTATVSESLPNSTYYYWLVADYTVTTGAAGNFTCSLVSGQSAPIITATSSAPYNSVTYNNYNVTGNQFTIVTSYTWVGTTNDVTDKNNFLLLGSATTHPASSPFATNSTITVIINSAGTPPNIAANTEVGGISFLSTGSLTMASGKTLKLNTTGLDVAASTTATITGGTLNIATGTVSQVASTGVLMLGASTTINNSGTFTLVSDANGSASIGTIPLGSSFTGNVNAQRYMSGGVSTARSYRFLSSPVFTSTFTSPAVRAYYLYYLQATTPITGWGAIGTYSFTQPSVGNLDPSAAGNPSALFYYEPEADPPSNSLSVSNYKGIASTGDLLPIGNGFLFFFRGNRNPTGVNGVGKTATGAIPENTTLNNFGTLNQGDVQVYIPTAPLVTYSGSILRYVQSSSATDLSTNFSYTNKTPATDGLHLVGNPYPCTIDLENLDGTLFTNPYSTSNNLVYMLNNSGIFGAYRIGSASSSQNNGIGRYVSQGQGFFVRANAAGNTTLKFTEACKVTSGYTAPISFAIAANSKPSQSLHITLAQDSLIRNETVLEFGNAKASKKYSDQEDAYYMSGPSQTIFMASYSSDNVACIINQMGKLDSIKTIGLLAESSTSGRYTMTFDGASTIDPRYKLYLKDNLLADSLDLSANATYTFNIDRTNNKTYGAGRFTLVVYPTHIADKYNLISFNGIKKATSVDLTWKTQNEGDYTGFTLQRSTDNWKTHTDIVAFQSDGSGIYNFTDNKPVNNAVNEYKLSQNNIDNVTLLSNAIAFSYLTLNSVTKKLNIYPNPVVSDIKIAITADASGGALQVKIFNIRGEMVKNTTFEPQGTLNLSVANLMHGAYIIEVSDSKKTYGSTTFTKQ